MFLRMRFGQHTTTAFIHARQGGSGAKRGLAGNTGPRSSDTMKRMFAGFATAAVTKIERSDMM